MDGIADNSLCPEQAYRIPLNITKWPLNGLSCSTQTKKPWMMATQKRLKIQISPWPFKLCKKLDQRVQFSLHQECIVLLTLQSAIFVKKALIKFSVDQLIARTAVFASARAVPSTGHHRCCHFLFIKQNAREITEFAWRVIGWARCSARHYFQVISKRPRRWKGQGIWILVHHLHMSEETYGKWPENLSRKWRIYASSDHYTT